MGGSEAVVWKVADYIALANTLTSLFVGIALMVVTFRGPVIATRQADERRDAAVRRGRQMDVFRLLMGHRYDVLTPNFVSGLNLVQIEFATSATVMQAFSAFLVSVKERNHEPEDLVREDRKKAIIRLLTAIGDELGYKLEQLDLMEQVYSPQGWKTEADKQAAIRDLMHDVATGKKGFPVYAMLPTQFLQMSGPDTFAVRVALQSAPVEAPKEG